MKRALWSLGFTLVLSGTGQGAQGEVEIVQRPIQCWPTDRFLMLQSEFVPPGDIQTAKFYFRDTDEPDYYYVEFTLGPAGGSAIAPMAEPTTESVTFYTELVSRSYSSFRTEETVVPVASGAECQRRDPETAFYNGQNPDIAVGATRAGATPLPPGFQAQGIAKFLNATGIVGQPGGGLSGKTIGIIAGLGAGAGGALALTGSGSSETTTTGPFGGSTSSVSSTSTSTAIGGGSSSTTTASGGGSTSSTTTTVGGGGSTSSTTTTTGGGSTSSTTTTTVGGSTSSTTTTTGGSTSSTTTTTTGGSTSSTTTTTAGGSTSSTTTTTAGGSTSSTTTTAGTAQLRVSKSGPASVALKTPFNYSIQITNVGSAKASSVQVEDVLPATFSSMSPVGPPGGCQPFGNTVQCFNLEIDVGKSLTIRIQVISPSSPATLRNTARAWWGNPRQGPAVSNTVTTGVPLRTDDATGERVAVKTFLDVEPYNGRTRGRILSNDSEAFEVTNTGPVVHNFAANAGENRVEASFLAGGSRSRGIWRFDFGGAARFVPGSIRVDSGLIYGQGERFVAFTVEEGSSLRFRYRVSDDSP